MTGELHVLGLLTPWTSLNRTILPSSGSNSTGPGPALSKPVFSMNMLSTVRPTNTQSSTPNSHRKTFQKFAEVSEGPFGT